MKRVFIILFVTIIAFAFQTDKDLNVAIQLSQAGEYEKAEEIFNQIEHNHNEDIAYNIARGYNFSWWGKFDLSKACFNQILKADPKNIDAIIGLAFALHWSNDRAAAVHIFNRAIFLQPQNTQAYVGLIHNYLESDNIEGARYLCNQLLQINRELSEAHYLDGIIHLRELHPKKARNSFKEALTYQPDHTAAKEQLGQLVTKRSKWEFEGWYGLNTNSVQNGTQHGVRSAHVQYHFDSKNLAYVTYDNSLMLDNSFLAARERFARYFGLGTKIGWSNRLFTKLEGGFREFENLPTQTLINVETDYFFSSNLIAKAFLQYDNRQGEKYGLMGLALDFGITNYLRFEPSIFNNQNYTLRGNYNRRFQLSAKYLSKNVEIILAGYTDQIRLENNILDSNPFGIFGLITFPLHQNIRAKLFANYDQGIVANRNSIGAFGLNINL